MVCAALARDATAVELGLDRLEALDIAADPNLAGLARAAVAGTRFALRPPVADDAILLPLLRSVPLIWMLPRSPACRCPRARR